MKIKLSILFIAANLLVGTSNLYAMKKGGGPPVESQDNNYVIKRKMFILNPDYRDEHQILIIKALSSVFEYAGRAILVVKLIDNSDVPFYRSSGANSGLPKAWLPFFGLRKDGWLHKNYSFAEENNTHIHLNPLYHSGCYVLAQISNELDRLPIPIAPPSFPFKDQSSTINAINCWIGGKMLEPQNMPQLMHNLKDVKLSQSSPLSQTESRDSVWIVDTTTTVDKNLSGDFRNINGTKKTAIESGNYFHSRLTHPSNSHLTQDPFAKKPFLKEMSNTVQFVYDLQTLARRMVGSHDRQNSPYIAEYTAFNQLIAETLSLEKVMKTSPTVNNKANAYLALQMLKRFSFNYVYKMLVEVVDNRKYSEEFFNQALAPSRAIWVMIKHNKEFGDHKKNDQIRTQLSKIKKNSPLYFNTLRMEKPIQITRFVEDTDYDIVGTIVEESIENINLLKEIREKASQIYRNPDYEIPNIRRVIQKGYHIKTLAEIIDHYNNTDHLLEIEGVNHDNDLQTLEGTFNETLNTIKILKKLPNENERKPHFIETFKKITTARDVIYTRLIIPEILNKIKHLNLKDLKNYITSFEHLFYLKNVFHDSNASNDDKERAQLSIEQIATVLYMDALTKIPTLKPLNE